MPVNSSGGVFALSFLAMFSGASAEAAESIADAMATAYASNPTLTSERARQRSTDEQIPQALSGWRPRIEATANIAKRWDTTRSFGFRAPFPPTVSEEQSTPANVFIGLTQPLFRGFKTVEGTAQAEANVNAGNQNLLAVEQQVLFQTAQSYVNVVRDRRIVDLRKKNVSVLQEQLRAAQARFDVGEVTRTDVAQARARLSFSKATLANAKAQLASSTANYTKLTGHTPGALVPPKVTRTVPHSLKEAVSIAERQNPNVLAAAFVEVAAMHAVEVAKGDLMPEMRLEANASKQWRDVQDDHVTETQELVVRGVIDIPLYEQGRVYSQVRAQKQVASQRRIEVIETKRSVREAVSQSWAFYIAAQETITAAKAQVSASALALDGVKQEYLVGSRTTLDVLNSEAELTDAQVNLVQAERDHIVAAYQLVASMGKLTARNLKLNVAHYDSHSNARAVRNKWIGTDVDTID